MEELTPGDGPEQRDEKVADPDQTALDEVSHTLRIGEAHRCLTNSSGKMARHSCGQQVRAPQIVVGIKVEDERRRGWPLLVGNPVSPGQQCPGVLERLEPDASLLLPEPVPRKHAHRIEI